MAGTIATMLTKHHIIITRNTCSFSWKAKAIITIMLARNRNVKNPKIEAGGSVRGG